MLIAIDDIRRYFDLVYRPEDIVELRALGVRDGSNVAERDWIRAAHIATPGVQGWIERVAAKRLNVYVGANPRKAEGKGDAANVALARSIFADFDGVEPHEAVMRAEAASLPSPTLVIASGHGAHLYWCLEEGITDLGHWTGLQRRLIWLLGSDASIKDPPRIMRLPGTSNTKRLDDIKECRIVGGTGARLSLADWSLEPLLDSERHGAERAARTPQNNVAGGGGGDWKHNITSHTGAWAALGAPQGERNRRAFSAACDLAGSGASYDEALDWVLRGAAACVPPMDADEAASAVRSAYSKGRTPAKIESAGSGEIVAGPNETHIDFMAGVVTFSGGEKVPAEKARPAENTAPVNRPEAVRGARIVNRSHVANAELRVETDHEGNDVSTLISKPIDAFAREIREAGAGWPRRCSSVLFVDRGDLGDDDPLPGMRRIWTLDRPEGMGAWLHSVADVKWHDARTAAHTTAGRGVTLVSKTEMHEYLRATVEPVYRSLAVLPHFPPMDGVYYVPTKLPQPTGLALEAFMQMLNPATDADRQLLLAAILTPGWGGDPGRRPPFVLTSEYGRGAGKTATASAISGLIWGGSVTIAKDETSGDVNKRLLSTEAAGLRCVLLDNIKGKLDGQGLESLITATTIDGHRMYVGQSSRINDFTFFLTINTPRLSKDLADRSVVIKIGQQRHGQSFVSEVTKFVKANRPALLADIYARLAEAPRGEVSAANRDRWQDWQDSVLCRCDEPDALAKIIIERRSDVDDDGEDAAHIADAIRTHLRARTPPDVTGVCYIRREEMRNILVAVDDTVAKLGVKGVTSWLSGLLGAKALKALANSSRHDLKGRVWSWRWSDDIQDEGNDSSSGIVL
jgi:hypothetical protein